MTVDEFDRAMAALFLVFAAAVALSAIVGALARHWYPVTSAHPIPGPETPASEGPTCDDPAVLGTTSPRP
jgi:hypothetical protein